MKDRLKKARAYEEQAYVYKREEQPEYHLIPKTGWMNDPNGFSYYGGKIHLLYQYYPYDTRWNSMHWGHYISEDFVKWEALPAALAPDRKYDDFGVFSGSAISHEGKHVLMYTGVQTLSETPNEKGLIPIRQTQCLAIGDGLNYEKLDEINPVIIPADVPGCTEADFRDPKIWKEGDTFYVIMAACDVEGNGMLPIFSSKDIIHWDYCGTVYASDGSRGTMCECPDYFKLDGKDVIITAFINMKQEGLEFPGGSSVISMIGNLSEDKSSFTYEDMVILDYGMEFYATHSIEAEDGRRILIAWMSKLGKNIIPVSGRWNGMQSFPRELFIKNNHLYSLPIREIEKYYTSTCSYESVQIKDETKKLNGIQGRVCDMTVEIEDGEFDRFEITVAQNEEYHTVIAYDRRAGELIFDRTNSGTELEETEYRAEDHYRRVSVAPVDGKVTLRILLDRYSVEIFVNGGEKVLSNILSTTPDAEGIMFTAEGEAQFSVKKADISVL